MAPGRGGWPVRLVVEVVEVCRSVGDVAQDVAPGDGRCGFHRRLILLPPLAARARPPRSGSSDSDSNDESTKCSGSAWGSSSSSLTSSSIASARRIIYFSLSQATTVFGTCSSGQRVAPLCQLLIHAQKALCRLFQPHGVLPTRAWSMLGKRHPVSALFRRPFHRGNASAAACSHGHACPARQRRAIAQGNKLSASRPCLPARALCCW